MDGCEKPPTMRARSMLGRNTKPQQRYGMKMKAITGANNFLALIALIAVAVDSADVVVPVLLPTTA